MNLSFFSLIFLFQFVKRTSLELGSRMLEKAYSVVVVVVVDVVVVVVVVVV